ncbi:MAG: hypothetical protein IKM32_06125 [Clostridia bacterium]|nr:hypothetical protein [Clostridia bacterium]
MKKAVLISIAAVFIAAAALAFAVWNGYILLNNPSESEYSVRGVDVSHYQGEIDWRVLASQNIDFAFIKATEGASHTDNRFEYNYAEAAKTDLRIGAYHFFSFESSGKAQAEHFISTVPKIENMLPPVIDVEFYGRFSKERPNAEAVKSELSAMVSALYSHYGVMPIIYTAKEEYSLYISGGLEECPIWMRSVYAKPSPLPDGRSIAFWQYTNRARLDGCNGEERFIDMNVFCGTEEEFSNFGK